MRSIFSCRSALFLALTGCAFAPAASAQGTEPPSLCAVVPNPAPAPVCDGIVDDKVALQALLNQGHLSGAPVRIPVTAAGCRISGPLCVLSNTTVIQDGLLKLGGHSFNLSYPSLQYGMYTILRNAENVTIMGGGTLDGGLSYPPPTPPGPGCCMGGIVSGGTQLIGDYDANVRNITIRGLNIVNIPTWPVSIDGASNVRIDRITAFNSQYSFSVGHNSHNVLVSNLRISELKDVGFTFYRGVENGLISDSVVHDVFGAGIGVFTDWPNFVGPGRSGHYININGNVVYGSNGGIDVQSQRIAGSGSTPPTAGLVQSAINVTNNQVHHNNVAGISLLPCAGCQIVGNQSHHNGKPGVPDYAFGLLLSGVYGLLVSDNLIYNEGLRYSSNGSRHYKPGRAITVREINCVSDTNPTPGHYVDDWTWECPNQTRFPTTRLVAILGNQGYDDQAQKTMEAVLDVAEIRHAVIATGNLLGPVGWMNDISAPPLGSVFVNYNMP